MMAIKQVTPAVVAERNGFLGRADDVREQYRCEHPVNGNRRSRAGKEFFDCVGDLGGVVTDERYVVYSWKF